MQAIVDKEVIDWSFVQGASNYSLGQGRGRLCHRVHWSLHNTGKGDLRFLISGSWRSPAWHIYSSVLVDQARTKFAQETQSLDGINPFEKASTHTGWRSHGPWSEEGHNFSPFC